MGLPRSTYYDAPVATADEVSMAEQKGTTVAV